MVFVRFLFSNLPLAKFYVPMRCVFSLAAILFLAQMLLTVSSFRFSLRPGGLIKVPSASSAAVGRSLHALGLARVRGVIFDMDGTLTPPGTIDFPFLRTSIFEIASRDANSKSIDLSSDVLELIPNLSAEGQSECAKVLRKVEEGTRSNMRLVPGAVELLTSLGGRGVRTGVVTRNVELTLDTLRDVLLANGVPKSALPHPMTARDTVDPATGLPVLAKPDPSGLLLASNLWSIPAGECVMVGDSLADDVGAARRAGMRSVHIDTGVDNRTGGEGGDEEGATWSVRALEDVGNVLEGLVGDGPNS